HLVEVVAPVQEALRHAGATAQLDRVAQALTEAGEVPGASVAAAVVVARGAAEVAGAGKAQGARAGEEKLACEHLRRELLRRDRAQGRERRHVQRARVDQR